MLKIKSEDVLYHVFKVLHEGLQIIPGGILKISNEKATQKDLRSSLGLSEYKLDTGTSGTTLGRCRSQSQATNRSIQQYVLCGCVYISVSIRARVHDAVEEEECVMVKILKQAESLARALQRLCLALVVSG